MVQASDLLPAKFPNSLVRLPSGAILLAPNAGDALVITIDPCTTALAQRQPAEARVTQVLQSWLPVQDASVADLAGLSQPQASAQPFPSRPLQAPQTSPCTDMLMPIAAASSKYYLCFGGRICHRSCILPGRHSGASNLNAALWQ